MHRPGRNHENADALSRRPCRQCGDAKKDIGTVRNITIGALHQGLKWSKEELAKATKVDPEIAQFTQWMVDNKLPVKCSVLASWDPVTKSLHSQWERFSVKEGVLYCRIWNNGETNDSWQVVLPVIDRQDAMNSANASISGEHMGVKKKLKLAMNSYWVGWIEDVRQHCRKCDQCARYHRGIGKRQ